eukprot:13139256-Alexandrium_andersonii.AAC.1
MQAFYKVRGFVYQGRGPTLSGSENPAPVTAEDIDFFHGKEGPAPELARAAISAPLPKPPESPRAKPG